MICWMDSCLLNPYASLGRLDLSQNPKTTTAVGKLSPTYPPCRLVFFVYFKVEFLVNSSIGETRVQRKMDSATCCFGSGIYPFCLDHSIWLNGILACLQLSTPDELRGGGRRYSQWLLGFYILWEFSHGGSKLVRSGEICAMTSPLSLVHVLDYWLAIGVHGIISKIGHTQSGIVHHNLPTV